MRYLPEKLEWQTYVSPITNKGILFEHLVKEIIALEFPDDIFEFTPTTGDEGRDLETTIKLPFNLTAKAWAECKNLQNRLALSDISNTFVFAYAQNPSTLTIFSYTDLNENLKKELATFQIKSNVKTSYYAAEVLEELILRNRHKIDLRYYFPDLDLSRLPILTENSFHEPHVDTILVTNMGSVTNLLNYKIKYTELFYLKIYVENNFNDNKEFILEIPEDYKRLFHIENKELLETMTEKIIVNAHSIGYFTIPLRLNCAESEIHLPTIYIKYEKTAGVKIRIPSFKDRVLKVLWTTESILVGAQYIQAIDNIDNYLGYGTLKILLLHGNSGVGKSRMLNEISFVGAKNGYMLFPMNFEIGNTRLIDFCKNAIKLYEGFPFLLKKTEIDKSKLPLRKQCALEIYNEEYFGNVDIEYVAEYFCQLLLEEKCLFLLDNVQNADNDIIKLLNIITDKLNGIQIRSSIILSYNNDLLEYESTAMELKERLRELSLQQKDVYKFIQLQGFKKNENTGINEAYVYLKNILICNHKDQDEFNVVIRLIAERCDSNPFFLNEMLKLLENERVFERCGLQLEIINFEDFRRAASKLPIKLNDVLCRKYNHFKKYLSGQYIKLFEEFVAILNFTQKLPIKLYYRLFSSNVLLDDMLKNEFIDSDTEIITFHHHLLGDYINRFSYLDKELSAKFTKAIEDLAMTPIFFAPYFIAKDSINEVDKELCEIAMQSSCEKIEIFHLKKYADALLARLLQYYDQLDLNKLLNCFISICSVVECELGINEGVECLDVVYNLIKKRYDYFLQEWDLVNRLFYKVICAHLCATDYDKVIDICNEYENECTKAKIDQTYKNLATNMTCERRFQTYLKLDRIDKARTEVEKAYIMAEQSGSSVKQLKAMFAESKLNMYCNDIIGYVDICNKAYDFYCKNIRPNFDYRDYTHRDREIMVNIDAMLADLIIGSEKYTEKKKIINAWLGKSGMPYHEIKMRLALTAESLYIEGSADRDLLEQAKYLCLVHNFSEIYPRCFCMGAVMDLKNKEYESALNNLHMAVKAFLKIKTVNILPKQPNFGYILCESVRLGKLSLPSDFRNTLLKTDMAYIVRALDRGAKIEFDWENNDFLKEIPRI